MDDGWMDRWMDDGWKDGQMDNGGMDEECQLCNQTNLSLSPSSPPDELGDLVRFT